MTVTATKINQSQSAHVTLQATDVAGNVTTCDPVIALVQRNAGSDPQHTTVAVPQAESKVQVLNSTPGLKNLTVTVNGIRFKVTGLRDGEIRTINVASAMKPGNGNIITVQGHGPRGSSATVVAPLSARSFTARDHPSPRPRTARRPRHR